MMNKCIALAILFTHTLPHFFFVHLWFWEGQRTVCSGGILAMSETIQLFSGQSKNYSLTAPKRVKVVIGIVLFFSKLIIFITALLIIHKTFSCNLHFFIDHAYFLYHQMSISYTRRDSPNFTVGDSSELFF